MLFLDELESEFDSSCDSSSYDYFSDTESSTSSNNSQYMEKLLHHCDTKNISIIKNSKKIKNINKKSSKLQLLEKNKKYEIYYDNIKNLIKFIRKKQKN